MMALPAARAVRLYCTGLSHKPVSAAIPNAKMVKITDFTDFWITLIKEISEIHQSKKSVIQKQTYEVLKTS